MPSFNKKKRKNVCIILSEQDLRNKIQMPTLVTSIYIVVEVLAKEVRQEKDLKSVQTGKEELNLLKFADVLCIENCKEFTKKLRTN